MSKKRDRPKGRKRRRKIEELTAKLALVCAESKNGWARSKRRDGFAYRHRFNANALLEGNVCPKGQFRPIYQPLPWINTHEWIIDLCSSFEFEADQPFSALEQLARALS